MTDIPSSAGLPGAEELARDNRALRAELAAYQQRQRALWSMLASASRSLQVSSASIKAAVSSLLDHEIFWDEFNRQEFLETINASADQAGRMIRLLALTFQSEAGRLASKREPNVLPEILSALADQWAARCSPLALDLRLPAGGGPVLADDEHLTLALGLLVEVFSGQLDAPRLQITAQARAGSWQLSFGDLLPAMPALLAAQMAQPDVAPVMASALPAESQLQLLMACRLLQLHGAQVWVTPENRHELNVRLPAVSGPAAPAI